MASGQACERWRYGDAWEALSYARGMGWTCSRCGEVARVKGPIASAPVSWVEFAAISEGRPVYKDLCGACWAKFMEWMGVK